MGADYSTNAALSFTATGNNFELAISCFDWCILELTVDKAFAGVIGPLGRSSSIDCAGKTDSSGFVKNIIRSC
jgi:hypothetical protein